jgi:hypothetical protein
VQYSLQTLFKTAKLGGFINSSKCGGGGNGTANVQAVLYEGRQFYIATRDIEVGEEILHDYPCLDHHNDGIPSLAWFMKGGLSHDLEVLLADAEELAREGGDDAAVGTGDRWTAKWWMPSEVRQPRQRNLLAREGTQRWTWSKRQTGRKWRMPREVRQRSKRREWRAKRREWAS